MYDIIIIGAGTAGLTAAIYAGRASKKVLVLEAKSYGGQIVDTIDVENYPAEPHISGFDFANKIYNQAKEFGAEVVFEKVVDFNNYTEYKEVITNKNVYKGKTLILATGSDNRKLGIDREDDFLGKGISYCATCDGAFYKDKVVAVVGGGNTALEDALYLSNIAKKVLLIHRREEFRGEQKLVDLLKQKKNVDIIYNSNVVGLIGKSELKKIEIVDNSGIKSSRDVDALFVAIGRIPENQNFSKIITLDKIGYVVADEDCKTNIDGIFVAGDCRTKKVRQLVTAASDGAVAAMSAISYISNKCKKEN